MEYDALRATLATVADEYGIRLALLFGSAATGKVHERSDLDVAVLFDHPEVSFSILAQLVHELQSAAGEREIDLALLNRADPLFLRKITEGCVLLFGSESALHRLKILAFRRYQDHRPKLLLERKYIQRILSQTGA